MTFAVPRINPRTMPGSSTAPAARAVLRMRDLVAAHGIHHGAAARVRGRQAPQVLIQMSLHLAFGLGDEPQTGAIAKVAARAPMANEPAYHSGLSRLGREPSSRNRCSHQPR